jgi:hypothetical protein
MRLNSDAVITSVSRWRMVRPKGNALRLPCTANRFRVLGKNRRWRGATFLARSQGRCGMGDGWRVGVVGAGNLVQLRQRRTQ